jgi:hypothetical protein
MSLRGNLGEFSALETLQLIGQQQKTGTLEVRSGRRFRAFAFAAGRLVALVPETEREAEPLLATLTALGWIQADRARALQSSGAAAGLESLRPHCPVAGDLLEEVRRTVLQGRLDEVLLWSRGRFRFQADVVPSSDWPPLPLEEMLLESMRRLDETAELHAAGLRPETVPRCDDAPVPPPVLESPANWIAHALLPRCDGRKNLRRLGSALALAEYDILVTVQALERLGRLRLRHHGPTGTPVAEPLRLPQAAAPLHLALAVSAAIACGFVARAFTATVTGPAATAVIEERARFEDERAVRQLLEVYLRREGNYPSALGDLVNEGVWPARFAGRLERFHYRPSPGRREYVLKDSARHG